MHTLGIKQVVALLGGPDQLGTIQLTIVDLARKILTSTRFRRVSEDDGSLVSEISL